MTYLQMKGVTKLIKLLIADDEPLVQIGLNSMLDWGSLGIEVCGLASNGDAAYELIQEHRPEIVITDIQMPCSSGLDLVKRCRNEFGDLPTFIFLTSHENFNYAKEAISYQVVDYLIKIDLSPDTLTEAVNRALDRVNTILAKRKPVQVTSIPDIQLLQERFFIRVLNNLFENEEQLLTQAEELKITFRDPAYAVGQLEILPPQSVNETEGGSQPPLLKLYKSSLHMFQELMSKHLSCRIIALDMRHLAAIFCIDEAHREDWRTQLTDSFNQVSEMLFNYYSVRITAGIGRLVESPLELSVSYNDSRQITGSITAKTPILFWDSMPNSTRLRNVFNLSLFRNEIGQAFEAMDVEALHSVFSSITELLSADHVQYSQALDAASSILHFTVTLLPEGTELASSIFQDEPDNYCCLYSRKTVSAVLDWLKKLEDGLCAKLPEYKSSHKNYLVENAKRYVKDHLNERIVLQDIADAFSVSPNYLSQLFKKFENIGISEYISNMKIQKSQELLRDGNLKIYEVADILGFESAFYFSKVFKKVTGISPKDFRNT